MISTLTALPDVAKQRNLSRFGMRCSEAGVMAKVLGFGG